MGIPNAEIRYEFFTPYHRGFDLVWDFLMAQPGATFSDGILTAKGRYGYERARNVEVFADDQLIGQHTKLIERYAALEPVFLMFWNTFESAATAWKQEKAQAAVADAEERRQKDDELCARVLAAAASRIEARSDKTPKAA